MTAEGPGPNDAHAAIAATSLAPLAPPQRQLRHSSRHRSDYCPVTYTLLRGPVEPGLAALVGMVNEPGVGATSGKRHLERVDDQL